MMSAKKKNVWKIQVPTLGQLIITLKIMALLVFGYLLFYSTVRFTLPKARKAHIKLSYYDQRDYLIYHPPIRPSVSGRYFEDVDKTTLKELLPEPVELTESSMEDFIFVSAISGTFLPRLTLLAESIQQFYPKLKLIVYDLGLTKQQNIQIKQWCQVQIMKFDFAKYPPHVRHLKNYAFKPIIIAEAMMQFNVSGVFWVDSSIRFLSSNMSSAHSKALNGQGVTVFSGAGHSVYAVTPKEMYEYLPSIKNPMKYDSLLAGIILLYKTTWVIDHIVHWWVACALSPSCIFSLKNVHCNFKENRYIYFANCSRYDQSALSIIIHNTYNDIKQMHFQSQSQKFYKVERGGQTSNVKTCQETEWKVKGVLHSGK